MAGDTGVRLFDATDGTPPHAFWFGEDQARYVLALPDASALLAAAQAAGVPAVRLGRTGGQDLTLPDGNTISLATLRATHEQFFPAWMDGPTTE